MFKSIKSTTKLLTLRKKNSHVSKLCAEIRQFSQKRDLASVYPNRIKQLRPRFCSCIVLRFRATETILLGHESRTDFLGSGLFFSNLLIERENNSYLCTVLPSYRVFVLQKQPLPGIEAREFLRSFDHSKIFLFESISVPGLGQNRLSLKKIFTCPVLVHGRVT